MTLRALRCDGRVPRKSRYSRSGKPPLPDQCSRGRDRGFPEEQLENVSGPQALRFQKAKSGNVFATAGAPVAAPCAITLETAGSTRAGCSKMPGCKAPEILSHESYPFRYVEWRRMRETQQTGVFQRPVRKSVRDGGRPRADAMIAKEKVVRLGRKGKERRRNGLEIRSPFFLRLFSFQKTN